MTWWFWALLVVVLFGLYFSQVAGRLDRLHIRVDNAANALRTQLLRRASVALELAASGLLDPATSLFLAEAAHTARDASDAERDEAENTLTLALHAALPDADSVAAVAMSPGGSDLVEELEATTRRVELAKLFHEDAVRQCEAMRSKPLVRVLHLAGRAPWPEGIAIDASRPDGLASATA
jgi:hypothetical protein